MTTSCPSPHPRHLLLRLQAEWERLATDRKALDGARSWRVPGVAVRTLDDLLDASGLGAQGHSPAANAVLAALVAQAPADPLAARVVLQRLLPGLAALARRRSGSFAGQLDALGELLAAAWPVIRCFDLRRPRPYLVVSLLRSCAYHAFESRCDVLRATESRPPASFDVPVDPGDGVDAFTELVDVLREARDAGLAGVDVAAAARLATADSYVELAGELEVSGRTVRNRRDVVAYRIRRLVAAA